MVPHCVQPKGVLEDKSLGLAVARLSYPQAWGQIGHARLTGPVVLSEMQMAENTSKQLLKTGDASHPSGQGIDRKKTRGDSFYWSSSTPVLIDTCGKRFHKGTSQLHCRPRTRPYLH